MTSAIFYRPSPRWHVCAAFAAAILVHLAAVGLAARTAPAPLPVVGDDTPIDIIPVDGDPQPPEPIEVPPDIDPPPAPAADNTFIEERPTPPPTRDRVRQPAQRRVRSGAAAARLPVSSAKVLALSAPRPEYPYEARRQRVTGSGVAVLTIDLATGYVVEVRVVRSTGHAVLDGATISGLRRWRFRPGTVSSVQTPITYTLTGASF